MERLEVAAGNANDDSIGKKKKKTKKELEKEKEKGGTAAPAAPPQQQQQQQKNVQPPILHALNLQTAAQLQAQGVASTAPPRHLHSQQPVIPKMTPVPMNQMYGGIPIQHIHQVQQTQTYSAAEIAHYQKSQEALKVQYMLQQQRLYQQQQQQQQQQIQQQQLINLQAQFNQQQATIRASQRHGAAHAPSASAAAFKPAATTATFVPGGGYKPALTAATQPGLRATTAQYTPMQQYTTAPVVQMYKPMVAGVGVAVPAPVQVPVPVAAVAVPVTVTVPAAKPAETSVAEKTTTK